MTSAVRSERIADCPFSIAAEYAAHFFETNGPRPGEFFARIPLLKWNVALTFGVHYDVRDEARGHDEIRFRWHARARWLPDLDGTIRLSIATHRETRLVLDGSYDPPFGFLGAAFDVILGRRVAAATADDLVERLQRALESDERAFRRAHDPAARTIP